MIPKKKSGKFRLILNLSAPEGKRVNDGIDKELASLSYVSVYEVADAARKLGRGALMAKMDIKQAYRNVPTHQRDRRLLGMLWKGQVFVDTTLSFGMRSAPLIFSAVADAAQWIMQRRGVLRVFHYINDFITVGAPATGECEVNNSIMHGTAEELGLPIDPGKDEGPSSCLVFTGIEIDSVAMELRLPQEKLSRMKRKLRGWRGKKACYKEDLLSLISTLSYACKVVRAGISFLRRLIDLASSRESDQKSRVWLNTEARSDVEWWYRFSAEWNGVTLLRALQMALAALSVTSDASRGWGCGAFCGSAWFRIQWAGAISNCHITVQELVPIVIAAAVWGRQWRGQTVMIRCDNMAVVSVINHGSCRNPDAMHLARCLAFIKAKMQVELVASHIRWGG